MSAGRYLNDLREEIHTAVAATVDDNGLPVTCAIDMMDADKNSLYFLTAKGKGLYGRLKKRGYIALTGIKGKDTMSRAAISLRGKVKELGDTHLRLRQQLPVLHLADQPAAQKGGGAGAGLHAERGFRPL